MLSYEQTKKLIDFALRENAWPKIEQFMVGDLKQPLANALPIYQDSIEGHSNLLSGKSPKDIEHLFAFMSKRKLAGSPLKQKLSPEGQKRLQVASLLSHVLASRPMLDRILAEADERKAKPGNDVVYEVQPAKWKKAKPGQAQPLNLPMNPDAKNPEDKMEGMPSEYPAVHALLLKRND